MTGALILGVDPGRRGALAWLDLHGDLVDVVDMPDLDGVALGALLRDLVVERRPVRAVVEQITPRPGQGVQSVWTSAARHGVLLGVLGAWDVPTELVSPAGWKRAARLGKDKTASRQRACELWPGWSPSFARVRDDGRAEAALIARHGLEPGR